MAKSKKTSITKNALNDAKVSSSAAQAQELAASINAKRASAAKKQRLIFAGILGSVVLIGIATLVCFIIFNPNNADNKQNAANSLADSGEAPKSNWSKDGALVLSKNGAGEENMIKGVPTIDFYNDFICPGCGGFERSYGDTIKQIISDGVANVRYHPLAWFDNTSPKVDGKSATGQNYAYSTRATAAAIYVGEKAPMQYPDFMASMYSSQNQPDEGDKYDAQLGSNEAIAQKIVQAGISEDIAKAAVGLDGNSVSFDTLTDILKNVPAGKAVAGTTGGPYTKYAQLIGQAVSAKKTIGSTPAVFIYNTSGTIAKQYGGDQTHSLPSSPDDFLKTVKSTK